jgi:hypothetical protein
MFIPFFSAASKDEKAIRRLTNSPHQWYFLSLTLFIREKYQSKKVLFMLHA